MAGVPGFEPGNDGVKVRCLTAWLYPKMVGRDGFEPPNPEGADLQSAVFSHFTISPYDAKICIFKNKWWRMTGSNRRPSACKADALPAELILQINGDP